MIAWAICNFEYNVVHTNGGVVCVFTKKRMDHAVAEREKREKSEAAASVGKN